MPQPDPDASEYDRRRRPVREPAAEPGVTASVGHEARVRSLIAGEPSTEDDETGAVGDLQRLCRAALRGLTASGAGVSVMSDAGVHGMATASDARSRMIEELQFTLGEGPCLDAFASSRPVLTSDLNGAAMARWPGYAPAAHERGVRAVFAFPVQVGIARLGVLDVYRDEPGPLTFDEINHALTFAEVAVSTLLDRLDGAGGSAVANLGAELDTHPEVYQAQGMVRLQAGVSMSEALVLLRAHAYAHDRRLRDVAADVVARRLNLGAGAGT